MLITCCVTEWLIVKDSCFTGFTVSNMSKFYSLLVLWLIFFKSHWVTLFRNILMLFLNVIKCIESILLYVDMCITLKYWIHMSPKLRPISLLISLKWLSFYVTWKVLGEAAISATNQSRWIICWSTEKIINIRYRKMSLIVSVHKPVNLATGQVLASESRSF